MNREIIFRAWDTVNGVMKLPDYTYWDELHLCLNGELNETQRSGYYQALSVFNTDSFILMQYTGLKDKNGNRIFEGDLIQSPLTNMVYDVKFILGEFKSNYTHYNFDRNLWHLSTIIGNIHQNPELLP